jgi:hypothetical protein
VRRLVGEMLGLADALVDLLAAGAVGAEHLAEEVGPCHQVLR